MAGKRQKTVASAPRRSRGVGRRVKQVLKGIALALAAAVFLAACVAPAIVMNSMFGYMAILVVVFVVVISVGCLQFQASKVHALTEFQDVTCTRGEGADLGLKICNDAPLVCPRAVADIFISDLFGVRDGVHQTQFMMPAKANVDFGFDVDMSHVGVYRLGIDRVRMYDFLGIARRTLRINGRFTATVLPRLHPVEELHFSEDDAIPTQNHTKSAVMGGFDYTGVREYAMGDPMKQIHWKLSAHTREYMTKLRESNQQQEYAVILDFASVPFGSAERLMEVNDALIETALSLVSEVANHDLAHKLLYCGKSGQVQRTAMVPRSGLAELVADFAVITPSPDEAYPDAAAMVVDEAQEYNRATNVLVVTSRPTPALIQELQRVKAQGRSPELFVVVPAAYTSCDIENVMAPATVLEEYDVPYFTVLTQRVGRAAQGGGR